MDSRPYRGGIERLAGYLNEPYRQEEVLAAARTLVQPFTLREAVIASGLPTQVVHRVLGRLTKKGVLTRIKGWSTSHIYAGGRAGPGTGRMIPHGAQRFVYLYSIVEGR